MGAGHDRPLAEQAPVDVRRLAARSPRHLRRRLGPAVGEHRPAVVVQVEHRVRRDEVHVGRVVRVERADVTPVPPLPLVLIGHDVAREVVDVSDAGPRQRRDHVPAEVGVRVVAGGHDVDERRGVEDVVAHRRQAPAVVTGHRRWLGDLLVEVEDLALLVDLDHPERRGLALGDRDRGDGDAGTRLEVVLDHLARVHAVDVIGAEHADEIRALVVDQVEVLVDRVGRALEPERAAPHLRRDRGHVLVEQRGEAPRLADVAVEAVALVLRQHDDLQVPGVGEVRQGEVDQPVAPAEGHGRLRPVVGERQQTLPLAPGEHDDENLRFSGHHGRT